MIMIMIMIMMVIKMMIMIVIFFLVLRYKDEGPDYALGEEDRTAEILKDLEITHYDNVDKI